MAKKKATRSKAAKNSKDQSANLGFEAKLWLAADKLRNNMDAAEYKHTVLGLIFLKYISDAFEEHDARLIAGEGEYDVKTRQKLNRLRIHNSGRQPANSFTNDLHPDLRADYVVTNPPSYMKQWWGGNLERDPRWDDDPPQPTTQS